MKRGYFKVVWIVPPGTPSEVLHHGDETLRRQHKPWRARVCTKIARTKEIARAIQSCIPGSRIVSWIDGVLSEVR